MRAWVHVLQRWENDIKTRLVAAKAKRSSGLRLLGHQAKVHSNEYRTGRGSHGQSLLVWDSGQTPPTMKDWPSRPIGNRTAMTHVSHKLNKDNLHRCIQSKARLDARMRLRPPFRPANPDYRRVNRNWRLLGPTVSLPATLMNPKPSISYR